MINIPKTQLPADPMKFAKTFWPDVHFYKKQREIIYSVQDNDETVVPAGNMLGKDFVAGFIIPWFFLTRHPCRILTTSATEPHLKVLWAEIGNFIQTSKYPLDAVNSGSLILTQRNIRRIVDGKEDRLSYAVGQVASQDRIAAMQGHHIANRGDGIPRTLFVVDEASSVQNEYYTMCRTWADRILILGNPWPCENFFKHAVKGKPGTKDVGGDIPRPDGNGFYRKVIKIGAVDSPNVKLGLAEKDAGLELSNRMLIPGVKSYERYAKDRLMLSEVEQCVSLDAEFYEGAEVMLYPPEWLNLAEERARELEGSGRRGHKVMGIDTAEGGDSSVWAIADQDGLIALVSIKTPDTSIIPGKTLALMHHYGVKAENVYFDAGGGGKEHVDVLRSKGHNVHAIAFGGSASTEDKPWVITRDQRKEEKETQYIYKNRRAEMYGLLRLRICPDNGAVWGIPAKYVELRRQLAPLPFAFDGEGRFFLPPKNKTDSNSTKVTIRDLIGCSPDEADATVLAVFGLEESIESFVAGGVL